MVLRLLTTLISACLAGGLTYAGCVIWPLELAKPTGLVAGISVALGWALVLAVYLDSRSGSGPK